MNINFPNFSLFSFSFFIKFIIYSVFSLFLQANTMFALQFAILFAVSNPIPALDPVIIIF